MTFSGQPLVTVSMSVYNAERFLAEAIESVLVQTHKNFEMILVNDGSEDGSAAILAKYAERDKRIKVISQANGGPSAASNAALSAAESEYVIKVDSDDVMLPHRIERQLSFMLENTDLSVATTYALLMDRTGRIVGKSEPFVDTELGVAQRKPSYFVDIIHPACIMRKSHIIAVGGYSVAHRFAEDRELWGRLATNGYKLGVQPEYLLKQRLHGGSLTLHRMRTNELACRYIDQNINRRLDGLPEISYESFLDARAQRPRLVRLRSSLDDISSMLYKKATRDYAERRWFSLLRHSAGAIALQPSYAARMLRKSAGGASSSLLTERL